MWQIVAFALITLVLAYISRGSLHSLRSHGFYRFFAWECIVALILLNVAVWFKNALAWHQIISWFLLIVCIIPLVLGVNALRTRGGPDKQKRGEPELLGFERTTQLVTSGVYHYIRHPLYSSLVLLDWGVFFKHPSTAGVLLAAAASFFLILTAKADESECIQTFGPDYQEYMKQTAMFIPYIL